MVTAPLILQLHTSTPSAAPLHTTLLLPTLVLCRSLMQELIGIFHGKLCDNFPLCFLLHATWTLRGKVSRHFIRYWPLFWLLLFAFAEVAFCRLFFVYFSWAVFFTEKKRRFFLWDVVRWGVGWRWRDTGRWRLLLSRNEIIGWRRKGGRRMAVCDKKR